MSMQSMHLYPGCLNLRWMSLSCSHTLKPGNWCQLAHVHLPWPPALQNDRRFAALEKRLCVAQQSRDEGILQGMQFLRFGCMPFYPFFYSLHNHQTWFVANPETSHGWWKKHNSDIDSSMSWKEENGFQCQRKTTAIQSATMICAEETSHGSAQRIALKDCSVPMAYWNFASANCSNGDVCGVQLVFKKVRSPNLVLACFRGNHSILMLVCWSRMQLLDLFCYTFVEMWLRKR